MRHPPQWSGDVRRSVSQPLEGSSSQSARRSDVGHVTLHLPAVHVGVPFGDRQTTPHAPQLLKSDCSSVHRVPQNSHPTGHLHVVNAHCCPVPHARPHMPQFDALLMMLVSQPLEGSPSQSAKLLRHAVVQAPARQTPTALGRSPQTTPQAPQFV